jgi:hypothetical protein
MNLHVQYIMIFQKVIAATKTLWRQYPPLVMGRWRPVNETQRLRKIDLSNQDHCGPCGTVTMKSSPMSEGSRLHAWPTSHGHFL